MSRSEYAANESFRIGPTFHIGRTFHKPAPVRQKPAKAGLLTSFYRMVRGAK